MIYNENDPFAAEWLRNLIAAKELPGGYVDERSIAELATNDLAGFRSVHLFAGIGGWPLALRNAGWPDDRPVWTGSCPCQPFSVAGKGEGENDERHLWPEMLRLITTWLPPTIFGEQVASKAGRDWLSRVRLDLEALGYEFGAADLCAPGVPAPLVTVQEMWEDEETGEVSFDSHSRTLSAPHIRQRLFWVAVRSGSECERGSQSEGEHRVRIHTSNGSEPDQRLSDSASSHRAEHGREPGERGEEGPADSAVDRGTVRGIQHADSDRSQARDASTETTRHGDSVDSAGSDDDGLQHAASDGRIEGRTESVGGSVAGGCGGLRDSRHERLSLSEQCELSRAVEFEEGRAAQQSGGAWSDFVFVGSTDGKTRRVGSGVQPLANGITRDVGSLFPKIRSLAPRARNNRVGRLRGYGNAIVWQLAAEFVAAFLEAENDLTSSAS